MIFSEKCDYYTDIITEISKEVENNVIARLNVYAKQYVPRRTMYLDELVPLEDHQEEVVVLDVLECFPCVYIHLFVFEIKTKREAAALCMFENV